MFLSYLNSVLNEKSIHFFLATNQSAKFNHNKTFKLNVIYFNTYLRMENKMFCKPTHWSHCFVFMVYKHILTDS